MTSVADIIGPDGAAGSPDALKATSRKFEDVSHTASTVQQRLLSVDPAQWSGQSAEAFKEKANTQLPDELEKVARSFEIASGALSKYAGKLHDIQTRAQALAQRIDTEKEAAAAAASRVTEAANRKVAAIRASSAATDPIVKLKAEGDVARAAVDGVKAAGDASDANTNVSTLTSLGQQLSKELDAAAKACHAQLQEAVSFGVAGKLFGGGHGWLHNFGNKIASPFEKLAEATFEADKDFAELVAHPSLRNVNRWLQESSDAAKAGITVTSDAAIVTAAVAAGGALVAVTFVTDGLDLPVIEGLVALTEGLGTAGTAELGAKNAADVAMVVDGHKQLSSLEDDALDDVLALTLHKLSNASAHDLRIKLTGDPEIRGDLSSLAHAQVKFAETQTYQARTWLQRREAETYADTLAFIKQEALRTAAEKTVPPLVKTVLPEEPGKPQLTPTTPTATTPPSVLTPVPSSAATGASSVLRHHVPAKPVLVGAGGL